MLATPYPYPAEDQSAKADAGKPCPSLVPPELVLGVAEIRGYGNRKYGSSENYKQVEPERYIDALYRHLLAIIQRHDIAALDEESGLPHIWHLATNAAFLCEFAQAEIERRSALCQKTSTAQ